MAIGLSVSEIRATLNRSASSSCGDGTATTMALGSIFHRIAAELLNPEGETSLEALLKDQERSLRFGRQNCGKVPTTYCSVLCSHNKPLRWRIMVTRC